MIDITEQLRRFGTKLDREAADLIDQLRSERMALVREVIGLRSELAESRASQLPSDQRGTQ